jgi:hypothetical protein
LIFEKEIHGVFDIDRDYSLEAEFDDFDKLLRRNKGRSQSPKKEKDPDKESINGDLDIMDNSHRNHFIGIDAPNDSVKVQPKSEQKIMTNKSNNPRIGMGDRQIQTSKGFAVDDTLGIPVGRKHQKTTGAKQEHGSRGFGAQNNNTNKKDTPKLWARHTGNLMANKLGSNTKA